MKYCPKCQTEKTEAEFHRAADRRDGCQPYCKSCKKSIDASIYARGGEEYKARKRMRQRKTAARNAGLVFEYLEQHPCVDCGEADPIVLEFDHVRGQKKSNLSDLILTYSSWETIQAEIAKCEVHCANCHRRVTATRRGNQRYLDRLLAEQPGVSSTPA
jgi:hypothetical protein